MDDAALQTIYRSVIIAELTNARGVARIFEWGTSAEGARSEAPKFFDILTLKWCILVRI